MWNFITVLTIIFVVGMSIFLAIQPLGYWHLIWVGADLLILFKFIQKIKDDKKGISR